MPTLYYNGDTQTCHGGDTVEILLCYNGDTCTPTLKCKQILKAFSRARSWFIGLKIGPFLMEQNVFC